MLHKKKNTGGESKWQMLDSHCWHLGPDGASVETSWCAPFRSTGLRSSYSTGLKVAWAVGTWFQLHMIFYMAKLKRVPLNISFPGWKGAEGQTRAQILKHLLEAEKSTFGQRAVFSKVRVYNRAGTSYSFRVLIEKKFFCINLNRPEKWSKCLYLMFYH